MKVNFIITLALILSQQVSYIFAQDWETAPEIWSEPVLLDSVFSSPTELYASPSLTQSWDTIYFGGGDGIYFSHRSNNRWIEPIKLSENVNGFDAAVRNSTLSRDGKRLYFTAWGGGYGGWDLWYSEWNNTENNWGPAKNIGEKINSEGLDYFLFEQSRDTIYTIQDWSYPKMYVYDSLCENWELKDEFIYHELGGIEMYGMSLTHDGKKLYCGKRRWEREWGIDLCVTYWDTNKNYWGDVYYLNINTKTVPWNSITKRGGEYYPWISSDGNSMVFASNREVSLDSNYTRNYTSLYISYLLVDENGDTVTSTKNENEIPSSFTLYQNFPNPFNPGTQIKFQIPQSGYVSLIIYNILGKEVITLINEEKQSGSYTVMWDGRNQNGERASSGIYFYQLSSNDYSETCKMLLLR